MKKNGFTLVELLAVIAILAILVIIALPNVMNLFNRAKQNAFETELKEVFKTAQQQWIADSMFNTQEREYANCKAGCSNKLDMSGRSELEYYIKLDKSGNVVSYKATDGSYQYSYSGTGLKIEDISDVTQISKIDDEGDIISITCNGATGGNELNGMYYIYNERGFSNLNDTVEYSKMRVWCETGDNCALGSYSETKEECEQYGGTCAQKTVYFDRNIGLFFNEKINYYRPYYIKERIESNVIKEAYICIVTDKEYCLRGGDGSNSYSTNLAILQQNQSYFSSCSETGGRYSCTGGSNDLKYVVVYTSGDVEAGNNNAANCEVTSDGLIACAD